MDAMTILRRCRESDEDIRRLEQRIAQRRMAMDSLQAPQMDPNGGSRGSGDPDKTGRMVAELDLLERDRDRRNEERNAEIASACALLDMVPELESKVLYAYYVETTPLGNPLLQPPDILLALPAPPQDRHRVHLSCLLLSLPAIAVSAVHFMAVPLRRLAHLSAAVPQLFSALRSCTPAFLSLPGLSLPLPSEARLCCSFAVPCSAFACLAPAARSYAIPLLFCAI